MLNRRETLLKNCSTEIDYIVRSLDEEKVRSIWPQKSLRDVVVDQIIHSYGRQKKEHLRDALSLRESNIFILAQICQTEYVKSWEDFKAEVIRRIPVYRKAPRNVLALGALPWKLRFEIPEKKARPKKPREKVAKRIKIPEGASSVSIVKHKYEKSPQEEERLVKLEARIERLRKDMNALIEYVLESTLGGRTIALLTELLAKEDRE